MTIKTTIKGALASITDRLAAAGPKLPPIAQVTVTHGGTTLTVTPPTPIHLVPPAPIGICPHCGK